MLTLAVDEPSALTTHSYGLHSLHLPTYLTLTPPTHPPHLPSPAPIQASPPRLRRRSLSRPPLARHQVDPEKCTAATPTRCLRTSNKGLDASFTHTHLWFAGSLVRWHYAGNVMARGVAPRRAERSGVGRGDAAAWSGAERSGAERGGSGPRSGSEQAPSSIYPRQIPDTLRSAKGLRRAPNRHRPH